MVELLIGKKGTGKTKALIEKVNNALTVAKGNVVFISNDTNRNIFDVKSKARMADTSEFEIKSYDEFLGFICGIVSQDYDLQEMYLDSFLTTACIKDNLDYAVEKLDALSEKFGVSFVISASVDKENMPESVQKYVSHAL